MNDAIPMLRRLWLALLIGVVPFALTACDKSGGAGEPPLAGAAIGGPFTLVDQDGKTVTDRDFAGRYRLIYFGYTYCPDVCPTDLQKLMRGLKAFEASAPALGAKVQPIFITIDPARDTVAVMKDYVAGFDPRLIGLTGSEAEIAQAVRAYRVYASKAATTAADGSYLVDHSTFTFLMDGNGQYVTHFGHDTTSDEMAQKLKELVGAG